MSFTVLPPPQESAHIFFALLAMNGPLPAELKFREKTAPRHLDLPKVVLTSF